MSAFIILPKRIVEEFEKRGLDVEDVILSILSRELNLDPEVVTGAHLKLAERYLAEGSELVDREPVQASEKLYKAVEECVKALAIHNNLEEILRRVKKRGRWTVTDLENAVEAISEKLGEWIITSWDKANYLHNGDFTRQS